MNKRILAIFITGVFIISSLLAGCGNDEKNKDVNDKNVAEGPWFETEFHDFKVEKDEFIPSFSTYNDEVYFLVERMEENTNTMFMTLKKLNLYDYSLTELGTFSSDKNGLILNLYVNENGIYMTSQKVQWNKERTKVLESGYNIIICGHDGAVKKNLDITEAVQDKCSEGEAVFLAAIVCDEEDNIIITDNMAFVMAFNSEGETIADISSNYWGNGLLVSDNGTVYYSYTNELTWKQCFAPVSVKANEFGKQTGEIASTFTSNYCIDSNEAVWLSDENTLIVYSLATEEKREIFDWIDYDITADSVRMLEVLEDGRIVACIENMTQDQITYEVAVFKESDSPLEEKTILTYATFGSDTEIMEAIVRFNKNSEEYRIKVIDYYDEENFEDAWNEYNQAVIEGDLADIVNVSWSNYSQMAEKGVYANLNEFMNADEDIHREDYFENILSAYEIDGKLYAMPASFSISTLVGKEKIWGNKDVISLEEVKDRMDEAPANVAIMDSMSQSGFVFFMLQGSLATFVDWENGDCSFATKEFVEILQLSKRFPKEVGGEEDYFVNNETIDDFREDKVLLYGCELYEITEYQMTKSLLGEGIVTLGYPGANGGLIQNPGSLFAISEDSPNKDAAWEFVKCMISEEYQTNYIYYNNPIHKGAFEKQMESAMERISYVDENGDEVETPKMSYEFESFEMDIYAATEEDVAEYRKIVENATTLATYDEKIMRIVEEEAEAYFNDQKSAEDVAKIIQSRVNVYVNETK